MTISAHTITAWAGTSKIDIKDATISMDEGWAPYVQASLTTVLDQSVIDKLDPRTGARLKVFVEQSYGTSDKLSSLSATFGGGTVASMTTVWTGESVADLSAWYFVPYNPSGSNKLNTLSSLYGGQSIAALTTAWAGMFLYQLSEKFYRSYPDGINNNFQRSFDLTIRSRQTNLNDGEVTLTLSSDESLLQDFALVQELTWNPGSLQLRQIIKNVLAFIGDSLLDDTTDATVDATAALWQPGQNAWEYLIPLVQKAGLRLFCDENRMWHLVNDTFTQPGLAELWNVGTIVSADETVSRDNDEWFDSVVIKYTYVNALGATVNSYDIASVTGFKKTKLIEIQSANPGTGAAQRILNRAISRGRLLEITAVSNIAISPSMASSIYIINTPTENGYVKAITWNYPGDEMTVTTRQPVNN